MNISKFTQKSVEAIQNCEKVAAEYGNQEIDQEHLIYSLITLDDSLIIKLIEKMEIQPEHFRNRVEDYIANQYGRFETGDFYLLRRGDVSPFGFDNCSLWYMMSSGEHMDQLIEGMKKYRKEHYKD